MALPAEVRVDPRVVRDGAATTPPGQALQVALMERKRGVAFYGLLAVAIVQTLGAVLLPLVVLAVVIDHGPAPGEGANEVALLAAVLAVVAFIFWGLWWWSRTNPLAASIAGLVLYVTLLLVGLALDPMESLSGLPMTLPLVAVLVAAVVDGVKQRQIRNQIEGGSG